MKLKNLIFFENQKYTPIQNYHELFFQMKIKVPT